MFSQDLLHLYQKDSLIKLGVDIRDLRENYSFEKDKVLAKKIEHLVTLYKVAYPFKYYVESKVELVGSFLFHKGTYYLPFSLDSPCFSNVQYGIKVVQALMYWIVLVIGGVGLFLLLFKSRVGYLLLFIPFYLVLLFPLIFKSVEWRYFHHAYPFLSVGVFVLIKEIKFVIVKEGKNGKGLLNS